MKIDQDYLKRLLEAFESSQEPTVDRDQLAENGLIEDENIFVFHMQILNDQRFIEREDKEPGFGYYPEIAGDRSYVIIPLRLTSHGYQFLEAIRNKEIWSTIKTEFKEASLGTLWKVSKELLEAYTRKKLERLLKN